MKYLLVLILFDFHTQQLNYTVMKVLSEEKTCRKVAHDFNLGDFQYFSAQIECWPQDCQHYPDPVCGGLKP